MLKKKFYTHYDSWKKFQYFFPERFRITDSNKPKEEHWERKNMMVHIDRYIPDLNERKTKVVLVHGGGGNGRLMSPFGVVLKGEGYESVSLDLPGFGLTEYKHPVEYQEWINLLVDFIDKEYKRDNKKIVLLGASLGGMLSYQVACLSSHVKGIIVTALIDTTDKEIQKVITRNDFMATKGSQFMHNFAGLLDNVRLPIRELTKIKKMANNEDFVYLLSKDKVGSSSWIYLKWLRTLQTTRAAIEPDHFDKCPLLWLHPEKDRLVDLDVSKPFFDRLKCDKELVILENCGHVPLEEPGMTQMENEIKNFLNKI